MHQWLEIFQEELGRTKVKDAEFRQSVQRLLDTGAIVRGDSKVETEEYEVVSRCFDIMEDYLSLLGFRLYHNATYQFILAYPPGARVPVLSDVDYSSRKFRKRLGQQEVLLALVLRFLYQKAMTEGRIDDDGEAPVTLEDVVTAVNTATKKEFSTSSVERAAMFREMERMKLIRYEVGNVEDAAESWVFIRPMIISLVSEEVLESALHGGWKKTAEEAGLLPEELPELEDNDGYIRNPKIKESTDADQ